MPKRSGDIEPMPEYPSKWIMRMLKEYLTADKYNELMSGYALAKKVYDTAISLRSAQQQLRTFKRAQLNYKEGTERWRHHALRIESKRSSIVKLTSMLDQAKQAMEEFNYAKERGDTHNPNTSELSSGDGS